jgi:CheY-like chemotaxis protein
MSKDIDILAIDDEQVIIDAIHKLCSAQGWEVDICLNGSEALEKIAQRNYRLIICDIMMPGVDGFQVLERLASAKISTPLVITTGYSTVENAVKSLGMGAIEFISKPFTHDELIGCATRGLRFGELQKSHPEHAASAGGNGVSIFPYPANCRRLGKLSWISLEEDGAARIGPTPTFLYMIQDALQIEPLDPDEEMIQGNPCLQIESPDKIFHSLTAPVTGRIIQINPAVVKAPRLMFDDPFREGWIYRAIPFDWAYESQRLIECRPADE